MKIQPTCSNIAGVVLAGGHSRRMGGIDKGWVEFQRRPMIEWVVETLKNQVDYLMINVNKSSSQYDELSIPLVKDKIEGFKGPLAGLHAAMMETNHPFIMMVPCDSPLIPDNLVSKLSTPLSDKSIDLAVVRTSSRLQPIFCLTRTRLREPLARFLYGGGRKIDRWFDTLNVFEVDFTNQASSFINFNTPEDIKIMEKKLSALHR